MKELIEKVIKEYQEKLSLPISKENVSKMAVYGLIATFVEREELNQEYKNMLLKQDNTLDYLYQSYLRCRYNTYQQIKESLFIDQDDFLAE